MAREQSKDSPKPLTATHGASNSRWKQSICAEKLTYEDIFYRMVNPRKRGGESTDFQSCEERGATHTSKPRPYGFATKWNLYCTGELKKSAIWMANIPKGKLVHRTQDSTNQEFSTAPREQGAKINTVHYVGIAEDEPKRLERLDGITKISPLHLIGWTEADCMKWCTENDLRSPTYDSATRGGCWFCHNQSVQQLRQLRRDYPELWAKLLQWDSDSPTTFKADGHTVHDYDARFQLEDKGIVLATDRWKWAYLECPPCRQLSLFEDN